METISPGLNSGYTECFSDCPILDTGFPGDLLPPARCGAGGVVGDMAGGYGVGIDGLAGGDVQEVSQKPF